MPLTGISLDALLYFKTRFNSIIVGHSIAVECRKRLPLPAEKIATDGKATCAREAATQSLNLALLTSTSSYGLGAIQNYLDGAVLHGHDFSHPQINKYPSTFHLRTV